jgi:hypothetical protein
MRLRGLWGALLGAITAAPLIAIFYLARAVASLPFVPFDVFDWMARILPGGVLTFGIDSLVRLIRGLRLGNTASVAKSAEHVMAIAGFVVTAVIAGAIFFTVRPRGRSTALAGAILGAALGIPLALISARMNAGEGTAPQSASSGWCWCSSHGASLWSGFAGGFQLRVFPLLRNQVQPASGSAGAR